MAYRRVTMRQIREILQLTAAGWSLRHIGRTLGLDHVTVGDVLKRARAAGLGWPLSADWSDAALEAHLYPGNQGRPRVRPEPDWPQVHRELQRKGVTLEVLWAEYRVEHPDGYSYTTFCERYRRFRDTLEVVYRQTYRPGEYAFVDYAGVTLPIYDPATGAVAFRAALFVMTLGYSNFTYAEWQADQSLASWVQGHVRALAYFQGVPRIWVPDNLKAGVTRADRYDPDVNPTYAECADHYGAVILPTRVRAPRDKAKVEKHVQWVETGLYAPVRDAHFTHLAEANTDLRPRLQALNGAPFQKLPGSRQGEWATHERAALLPLPAQAYEYAEWHRLKVPKDYHVELGRTWYSVPYGLVNQTVDARQTAAVVEIFHRGDRVASHRRGQPGQRVTDVLHMPPHHRTYAQGWTPEQLRTEAEAIGPHTTALVEAILHRLRVPEQAYRQCVGILQLRHRYSRTVLEAAAQRALQAETFRVRHVRAYCDHLVANAPTARSVPSHANVRGPTYYQTSAPAAGADHGETPSHPEKEDSPSC